MRGHWSTEDGGMSPEYVAVALVVAGLVAGVVALGLPVTVGEWGGYAVCELFHDGECERPDRVAADGTGGDSDDATVALPPPCVSTADSYTNETRTDWLFDRSVEGTRYDIQRLSDGSVVIIDSAYEGSGTVVGGGVELADVGLSGLGSLVDVTETGRMFVLDESSFEQYQDTMAHIAVDAYMRGGGLGDMGAVLSSETIEDAMGEVERINFRDMIHDILIEEHVTHDYYGTSSEVEVSFGAGVPIPDTPIVVGGRVGGGGSAGQVIAVDRETGERSITLELEANAELEAFVSAYVVGLSQGAAGSGSYSMTVDVDEDGNVMGAALTTKVAVDAGDLSAGLSVDVPGAPGSGASIGALDLGGGQSGMLETTFSLPVSDDPAAAQTLRSFVQDPMGNAGAFGELATEHGEVLVQAYRTEEEVEEGDLALRLLASAGIGYEDSHSNNTLVQAFSYDPTNGWLNREDCQ